MTHAALLPRLVAAYASRSVTTRPSDFFCAQLAREAGVGWLVAGDGGDEIFGGNERYRTNQIFARYGRLPAVVRRGLLEPLLLGLRDGLPGVLGRAQRYIRRARIPNPRRFYSYDFYVAQNARTLLRPDFLSAAGEDTPWRVVEEHFHRRGDASELNRLLYLDLKLTIGDNDLLKVTRTAELAGVAVRFPLLDLALVDFAGTLQTEFKVPVSRKSGISSSAPSALLLPRETMAKRKHGFGVPTAEWLRGHAGFRSWRGDTLLSARARERDTSRLGRWRVSLGCTRAIPPPFYGDVLWSL